MLRNTNSTNQQVGKNTSWIKLIIIGGFILLLIIPLTIGLAGEKKWPDKTRISIDPETGEVNTISTADKNQPGGIWEKAVLNLHNFIDTRFSIPDLDPRSPDDWITIFEDGFEGDFPGAWTVFDDYSEEPPKEYFWAKSNCNPNDGSHSAWAVGGGADGSTLNCGDNYPNLAESWMIYGPFSLADATAAEYKFNYWLQSETDFDYLFTGVSTDGSNFSVYSRTGNYDWSEITFDLDTDFPDEDLLGKEDVWIAFIFFSDSSVNLGEGAYIDDFVLRQDITTETPPPDTPTATLEPPPSDTPVPEVMNVNLPFVLNNVYVGPPPTPTDTPIPPTPTEPPEPGVALDGDWEGVGISDPDDGVYLLVVDNGTEVDTTALYIDMNGVCGLSQVNLYFYDAPVSSSGTWFRTQGDSNVSGQFTSATTAEGSYHVEADTGYCTATKNGTWEATYIP